MTAPYRVLVTGSRSWVDEKLLCDMLANTHWSSLNRPRVLIHGACPTGADAMADKWGRNEGWTISAHPADWEGLCDFAFCPVGYDHRRYRIGGASTCPAAGPRRNQTMVDLGADECLAFPTATSRGTWDCVRRAEAAGIPTRVFYPA